MALTEETFNVPAAPCNTMHAHADRIFVEKPSELRWQLP